MKFLNGKNNQATQNAQIDQLIQQNYDVLCVNLVDRTVASSVINKAKEANIPVIFFNREPVKEDLYSYDKAFYVGSQAEESGRLQGEMTAQGLKQMTWDKNDDGKVQYVMLEGERSHQDAVIRTETSIRALEQEGFVMDRLERGGANWQEEQAKDLMETWIQENNDEIELVIANNDAMAIGAVKAYLNLHYQKNQFPPIVGIDGTEKGIAAVRAGELYGTIINNQRLNAEMILKLGLQKSGKNPINFNLPFNFNLPSLTGPYLWLPYQKLSQ